MIKIIINITFQLIYYGPMDYRIEKTLNYIEANMNKNLDLKDLAAYACLSVSRFYQLFKSNTSLTPYKFIEQLRLHQAHQQLLSQPINIQTLSEHCGYKDYETFSRAYKKLFGLAPDDMAKTIQKIKQIGQSDHLHIATFSSESNTAISTKISELIEQLELSHEDLKASKMFIIDDQVNPDQNDTDHIIVKNKLTVIQHEKLWAQIINNL